MSHKLPLNGQWIAQFPEPTRSQLIEKFTMGNKLSNLIQDAREASLGLDPESQMELRAVERAAIAKLRVIEKNMKHIISTYYSSKEATV